VITVYIGEQRGGRVKLTTDRDCLSPDIIRFSERVFANEEDVIRSAKALESRGFRVCVDTLETFYETP